MYDDEKFKGVINIESLFKFKLKYDVDIYFIYTRFSKDCKDIRDISKYISNNKNKIHPVIERINGLVTEAGTIDIEYTIRSICATKKIFDICQLALVSNGKVVRISDFFQLLSKKDMVRMKNCLLLKYFNAYFNDNDKKSKNGFHYIYNTLVSRFVYSKKIVRPRFHEIFNFPIYFYQLPNTETNSTATDQEAMEGAPATDQEAIEGAPVTDQEAMEGAPVTNQEAMEGATATDQEAMEGATATDQEAMEEDIISQVSSRGAIEEDILSQEAMKEDILSPEQEVNNNSVQNGIRLQISDDDINSQVPYRKGIYYTQFFNNYPSVIGSIYINSIEIGKIIKINDNTIQLYNNNLIKVGTFNDISIDLFYKNLQILYSIRMIKINNEIYLYEKNKKFVNVQC